jgi:hypothetical protein
MRQLAVVIVALSITGCGSDSGGGAENASMKPGQDCLQCHDFSAAGTVFAATSSSDGVSGATVTFRDPDGSVITSTHTNSVGNFYTNANLPASYTVEVSGNGASAPLVMPDAVTSGGCNGCHGAGSRIHVP